MICVCTELQQFISGWQLILVTTCLYLYLFMFVFVFVYVLVLVFKQSKNIPLYSVKFLQQFIGGRQIVTLTKYPVELNYLTAAPRMVQ